KTVSKTDTLTVTMTSNMDGQMYRCVVTDVNGNSVISDIAVIYLAEEVVVLSMDGIDTFSSGDILIPEINMFTAGEIENIENDIFTAY
ncbi:MAG: hypothetical protein IJZ34_13700, partial [Lachnospiraceae bacterium]|nr:hypothetical protein [Lachnospiraceae bacterium]